MALEKIGPNTWKIKVSVRVKGSDVPVKKQETFKGSKTEAEQRKADLIKAIREQKPCSLTIRTFADILQTYQVNRDKKSGPDLSRIKKLKEELGHILPEVFADRFEEYLNIVRNTKTIRNKLPNPATINRIIEMVRAAFNLAKALGHIEDNPITKARFPKYKTKPRDRYLEPNEQQNLLNLIKNNRPHLYHLVEYSFLVPCRKSELVNLPRNAYNPFTNTIYVPDSKGGMPIHKPVPEHMLPYFRNIPADCPYLFFRQDKNGTYHSLGDFRKAWHHCLELAGLKDVRFHDSRHCAATDLYANGNPERVIMDIAGWKTPMLSTYRHKNSLKSAQIIRFSPPADKKPDLPSDKVSNE